MTRHYRVWSEELGQDEQDSAAITAQGPCEAAEEWAGWQDRRSAEYSIVGGNDANVRVKDISTGRMSDWKVSGESVPLYRARPVNGGAA